MGVDPAGLTERQQKWFASVQASLERDTGKSMDEWIAIARTCPETRPRARSAWLKEHHGLGANRGAVVLSAAFPDTGWDQPQALRAALWADPQSAAILEAVEAAASALPEVVTGQRKQFTAFSRKVQFAAARPVKGGKLMLGLAVEPGADPRLEPPRNEAWSERLKARLLLENPDQADAAIAALLRAAWARS
ncbi:DUF4287 domain-containing protein [Phenylobacterium hankyongense]|uniref:DUF4287 domain-containing protein n=1 Tax=Phenylobacterium hankyongense TaxID=1813876 RepID=A0A328B2W1_9CAUL|nr:DUF4287 domain-containing protein [Phenylobacterium hankyongense]RAK61543.1 DUF4287 domain-containing protein [Phenylobacterium hankyongense]